MKGFQEKCEKPPFLGILGQNAPFWTFLAKMGETGFFFTKALGTFFSHLQALTNCKVSEKSNERFPRKCVTDERTGERTNVRTDVTPKFSNDFVERPKMQKNIFISSKSILLIYLISSILIPFVYIIYSLSISCF